MLSEAIINAVISYLKNNYDYIVNMKPEEAVAQIMEAIRAYEPRSKEFIRNNWHKIKPYLARPQKIIDIVKAKDPELYNRIMHDVDWFNQFFYNLYWSIKKYMST